MLAERFKLVVEGVEDGADLETVKVAVSERFNLPLAQVNRLFAREQVTLRDDLDKERAWHVQRLLEDMNVRAKVIPMPLSNLKLSELSIDQTKPQGLNAGVSNHSTQWQSRASVGPTSQQVKAAPYRSRRTAVKTANPSSFKLSSILLLAGAIVAIAYAVKYVAPFIM